MQTNIFFAIATSGLFSQLFKGLVVKPQIAK